MELLSTLLYDLLISWLVPEIYANLIVMAASVVAWVLVGIILSNLLRLSILHYLKREKVTNRSKTIAKLITSVIRYVVWFVVLISILNSLNIDITPFIASAGVIGLAIGFGAQEIVKDFLSGFFIIFEGEFIVEDVIEVDGFKGVVRSIGLRTTTLRNWKGEVKIINNGNIKNIINYSKNFSMAIVDFGVAYDTDLERFTKLMAEFIPMLSVFEQIIEPPSFMGIVELANSSINMRIIAKTKSMNHFQLERDIRKMLVTYLKEHDVEIPFPQVVVHNA